MELQNVIKPSCGKLEPNYEETSRVPGMPAKRMSIYVMRRIRIISHWIAFKDLGNKLIYRLHLPLGHSIQSTIGMKKNACKKDEQ